LTFIPPARYLRNDRIFRQTLENYEEALAEPVSSAISALEEETTGLLNPRQQLSAEDPLAGLLDRVAAVTFQEAAKFRRGDYSF
jgi:hypothetical protein